MQHNQFTCIFLINITYIFTFSFTSYSLKCQFTNQLMYDDECCEMICGIYQVVIILLISTCELLIAVFLKKVFTYCLLGCTLSIHCILSKDKYIHTIKSQILFYNSVEYNNYPVKVLRSAIWLYAVIFFSRKREFNCTFECKQSGISFTVSSNYRVACTDWVNAFTQKNSMSYWHLSYLTFYSLK